MLAVALFAADYLDYAAQLALLASYETPGSYFHNLSPGLAELAVALTYASLA